MKKYLPLILVFGTIIISGCVQEAPSGEPGLAMEPTIEIEASVISLSPFDCVERFYRSPENVSLVIEYNATPPYEMVDIAVIKLDKVTVIANPQNRPVNIKEGDTATLRFRYTSRPAQIFKIPAPEGIVSPYGKLDSLTTLVAEVDGNFIYNVESSSFEEEYVTVLPGISIGSKLKANVWSSVESEEPFTVGLGCRKGVEITHPPLLKVYEYKLI